MPADIETIDCDCGHRMKVPAQPGGGRVECPLCGKRHTLHVDRRPLVEHSPETEELRQQVQQDRINYWEGRSRPNLTRRKRRRRDGPNSTRWVVTFLLVVLGFFAFIIVVNTVDFEKLRISEIELIFLGTIATGIVFLVYRLFGQ